MGGAVSSGRDNDELIDNLMEGNYIRTLDVERVFRALDRADYMTPEARDQAYKDLAWRNGPLHMSSPCIYSEVMEGLELRPGLSFLNVGSGTGYLSTMAGLVLGSGGINHGIEVHPTVLEYSVKKNTQFIENSPTLEEFDFCEPRYYLGNALSLAPLQAPYDRVYCGAGCPDEFTNYFKQLIRIGGILVMPSNDTLLQVKRVGESEWVSRSLLNVTFALLKVPVANQNSELIKLEEQCPPRLQVLSRGAVRRAMYRGLVRRHPELAEPPRAPIFSRSPRCHRHKRPCPRRIRIPIADREGSFDMLHDLDRENGANEMNALLSLVLSMGDNRVAGALRVNPHTDSSSDGSESEAADGEEQLEEARADAYVDPEDEHRIDVVFRRFLGNRAVESGDEPDNQQARSLTLEFHESVPSSSLEPADGAPPNSKQGAEETNDEVPADVEVYLDNSEEVPSTSRTMEWEESKAGDKQDSESGDETESITKCGGEKRQKLDSGIGEENTPSGSSPEKTEKSDESEIYDDSHQSDNDDTEESTPGRHRQAKRTRRVEPASSTDEDDLEKYFEDDGAGGVRRRYKKCQTRGGGARRLRLSILTKRAVKELPLPYALQKYVNLGRCF